MRISTIPDAKVFSKLDAKSGFLQIELDEVSSLLTTLNTPLGRYRWLRQRFQRIMDQMLEGIVGATAIMDDILIARSNTGLGREKAWHQLVTCPSYSLKSRV